MPNWFETAQFIFGETSQAHTANDDEQSLMAVTAVRSLRASRQKSAVAEVVDIESLGDIRKLSEADQEYFHERAAIREFDGGMDHETAERIAIADVERHLGGGE